MSNRNSSASLPVLLRPGEDGTASAVFIDARIADLDQLLAGIAGDARVFLLSAAGDGIAQIETALAGGPAYESVHILSHGASGMLVLGSTALTAENLPDFGGALSRIGAALSADGDILLYGCNVGAGAAGQSFISQVAFYTGADVAASDDRTGGIAPGGDWVLETASGPVNSVGLLDATALEAYAHTFDFSGAINGPVVMFGSAASETVNDVTRDAAGNLYITGATQGALPGNIHLGGEDAFVAKLSPGGSVLWIRQFGTAGDDPAGGIAVDASGNYYVAGATSGNLFGDINAGSRDLFLSKFGQDGTPLWSALIGGSAMQERSADVVLGPGGAIYIVGQTLGAVDGQPYLGGTDMLVSKFDASGTKVWTRDIAFGSAADYASGNGASAAVDAAGNLYIGATFEISQGAPRPYLVKLAPDGTLVYQQSLSASNGQVTAVAVEGDDLLLGFVTGSGASGAINVRRADLNGAEIWTRTVNTTGDDRVTDIAAGPDGLIYVAGETNGTLAGTAALGGYDSVLLTYDWNGALLRTQRIGTPANEQVNHTQLEITDGIRLVGGTTGDFAGQTNQGLSDIFVATGDIPAASGVENLLEMARFAQAAYHLAPDEPVAHLVNDVDWSLGARDAYLAIGDGWHRLEIEDLNAAQLSLIHLDPGQTTVEDRYWGDGPALADSPGGFNFGFRNGIYTNENAAALVAQSGDTLVIAFRGANDTRYTSGAGNPLLSDTPDQDHWIGTDAHWRLFEPLVNALDNYAGDPANGIHQVFVTGHGLGAGMVIPFMESHADTPNLTYDAITFASPGYVVVPVAADRITNFWVHDDAIQASPAFPVVAGDRNEFQLEISFPDSDSFDPALTNDGLLPGDHDFVRNQKHSMSLYLHVAERLDAVGLDVEDARNLNGIDFDDLYLDVIATWNEGPGANGVDDFDDFYTFSEPGGGTQVDGSPASQSLVVGSRGADTLAGGDAADALYGGAGNDTLTGGAGNDTMNGGSDTDTASYASAASAVTVTLASSAAQNTAGAGTDTLAAIENLTGSAFNDTLTGNSGNNTLDGGAGDDTLSGGAGNDSLNGGGDTDTASYAGAAAAVTVSLAIAAAQNTLGAGTDTLTSIENLTGSIFNDTLTGNSGNNTLSGGGGTDTVSYAGAAAGVTVSLAVNTAQNTTGAGTDTLLSIENLTGSAFNDTLAGNSGNNTLTGGGGTDTASYAAAGAAVTVSLAVTAAQNTINAGTDTLALIENLTGSAFNDSLTGNNAANTLDGADGNDALMGGAGNDMLNGGAGSDTASYAAAAVAVTVSLAIATAQNTVGAGNDTLLAIENLTGSAFNDTLTGNIDSNTLSGGGGNDTLNGGAGDDTLNGGAGHDRLNGGGDNDTATYASSAAAVTVSLAITAAQNTLGAGTDTLTSIENLTGSLFDDTLTGNSGNNTLNGGAAGTDTVSYAAAGAGVTVDLSIVTPQITGGAGTDTLLSIENLIGSAFDDTLTGGSGNIDNTLKGGAGNDSLNGGALNDTLDGGAGDDSLNGNVGTDTASYATAAAAVTVNATVLAAQDTVGAGTDTLFSIENLTGSAFNDILTGNAANNTLNGGAGNDTLAGLDGIDTLNGDAGNDALDGGADNDTLDGGVGNDTLNGGSDIDTASYASAAAAVKVDLFIGGAQNTLGAGTDTLTFIENLTGSSFNDTLAGNGGTNTLNGGGGTDTATYANAGAAVTVNLSIVTAQNTAGAGTDTLLSIENLTGSAFDDTLTGGSTGSIANNVLNGGAGNDTLDGGAGNDTLNGGAGSDTASYAGSAGAVTVSLAITAAQNTLGAGIDTLTSIENLTGSNFNDTLSGNSGSNTLDGGSGTDTASYAAAGAAVTVSLAIPTAQNTLGGGTDTLTAIESLTGSAFNDTLTGNTANNTLNGGGGNDTLNGGEGNDTLNGGAGNDRLNGDIGTDTASYANSTSAVRVSLAIATAQNTLGAGADTLTAIENLTGSIFNDTLTGNSFDNTLNGGAGVDTASYASAAAGVTVNLTVITAQNTGDAGTDTLLSIESLTGGAFDDTLTGNGSSNTLNGGAGSDTLDGSAGDDSLNGGSGIDTALYAGSAAGVTVSLAIATAQNTLGAGFDTLTAIENLIGSTFNDTLAGNGGSNTLNGGSGTDTASYAAAAAAVTVSLANAAEQNTFGAGTDTLTSIENLTGSAFNDTLTGSTAGNTLNGGAGNDTLTGDAGDDTLNGGAGNDTLNGGGDIDTASYAGAAAAVTVSLAIAAPQNTLGAGTDTLISIENLTGSSFNDTLAGDGGNNVLNGGAGIDRASYADAVAGVTVSLAVTTAQNTTGAGTDTLASIENLTGSAFDDTLTGNNGNNTLNGGAGNDTLAGGSGNDTLMGGPGSDTYVVGSALDVVTEAVNAGTDLVRSTATSYTLAANVENLTLLGAGNINGTGNALANVLTGNGGNNVLNGGAGTDTASYAAAAEGVTVSLIVITAQNTAGAGTDTLLAIENLTGSEFDDTLTGNGGNNTLNGGAGYDTLAGGSGNDMLNGGGGTDTASYAGVGAAVTVSLAIAGPQNTLGGGTDTLTSIENLTGSNFNDTLAGDGGNNSLNGGGGTDTASYAGAGAGVTVNLAVTTAQNTAGAGYDTLLSIENLVGSAFNDSLRGDGAANTLDGGAGDDALIGEAGNDTYVVDSALDVVTETSGAGTDTVRSSATSYTLPDNVENLLLLGTGGISATGNALDNVLAGNSGSNALDGGDGNDVLRGLAGADVLTGGDGADVFDFNALTDSGTSVATRDSVMDFSRDQGDRIDLMTIDSHAGVDGNNSFRFIGTAAFSSTDASGQLRFDAASHLLLGSTDADTAPEFSILLPGIDSMVLADFTL